MKKRYDFSKLGGWPGDQSTLDFMQTSYSDAIDAISGIVGSATVPVTISGMVKTIPGLIEYSAGWMFYNGELIRFAGGSYTFPGPGNAVYIVINEVGSTLTFIDGSTPTVAYDKTATISVLADTTPVDATHVLLDSLKTFGEAVGAAYKASAFTHVVVSAGTGGVAGDLYYKKNMLTNTLHMHGAFAVATPGDFAALPAVTSTLIATTSAGNRPVSSPVPFMAQVSVGGNLAIDDDGIHYSGLRCNLATNGEVSVDFVKGSTSGPWVFNVVLPLD